MWLLAAVLSAVFAGLTAILAKCGIKKTDSDVATALPYRGRLCLFVADGFSLVGVGACHHSNLCPLAPVSAAIGRCHCASWMCYFKALSIGDINQVVPIDKSSTVLSVLLAIVCFQETAHLAAKLVGTALLGVGFC